MTAIDRGPGSDDPTPSPLVLAPSVGRERASPARSRPGGQSSAVAVPDPRATAIPALGVLGRVQRIVRYGFRIFRYASGSEGSGYFETRSFAPVAKDANQR
jgi:hypothetical protein